MHNYTVKDSSIWCDNRVKNIINKTDNRIQIGMIQSETYSAIRDETVYIVDVLDAEGHNYVPCVRMTKFGSPYNYEEFTRQTYESEDGFIDNKYDLKDTPGEVVVVAILNGGNKSGVTPSGIILGSVSHPYRSETLKRNNEVAYISEFNGIETYINKDGEWRQTYRGIQENADKLRESPTGDPLPEPIYNEEIGGSYVEWSKDGSWLLTDNAKELPQIITVNKKDGKIEIISGNTSLIIDKKEESYSITNKKTTINSEESFDLNTKKTTVKSTELFDLEAQDIKTKGKWTQEGDVSIKGNTETEGDVKITGNTEQMGNTKQTGNVTVTGNLTTTGQASLAGGAKPLITDIIVVIGVGNLGAPVVSSATILTTTMTKAT